LLYSTGNFRKQVPGLEFQVMVVQVGHRRRIKADSRQQNARSQAAGSCLEQLYVQLKKSRARRSDSADCDALSAIFNQSMLALVL
jgi:predicted lipid-binding transport protein (Tim44 family)